MRAGGWEAGLGPANPVSEEDGKDESFSHPAVIALPTGGGAIRGISENFSANPVTGTSSLSVPLPVSPARGFEPPLALSYDSGAGNGPFGLGWSLKLPSIGRKTEQGLPVYRDQEDADTYVVGGIEDLIPLLESHGADWREVTTTQTVGGVDWEVKLYRPRLERAFSKIERWRNPDSGIIWWRTITGGNLTSVYGYAQTARIADPADPTKIFRWLLDCTYDDKGHYTRYVYKPEDHAGIDHGLSFEAHRADLPPVQTYLKRVLHGVKRPYWNLYPETDEILEKPFTENDFHFQTVFDYGEHAQAEPGPEEVIDWETRPDPFSNYRAGFEIRTYRRCKRVLLFHRFEQELANANEPVSAVSLDYRDDTGFSFLTSITRTGYRRDTGGRLSSQSLPAMIFGYQEHTWSTALNSVDADSLRDLPEGIGGERYQWVDLYSEGLSGVLSEQARGLYYKRNLGDGRFAEAEPVSPRPSLTGLATSAWRIQDLGADGVKSMVSLTDAAKGFYKIDDAGVWQGFQPFTGMPNVDFADSNLRVIDLTGDGKADLLVSEEHAFRWYPSSGEAGYGKARETPKTRDEDRGAALVFANESESIFLADMSGDGLQDIVRIRNRDIAYWPNLGYGRFGAKVAMGQAPEFHHPDLFRPGHIRLADLDGSGTTDLVYLGRNEFRYWLNLGGNRWGDPYSTVNPFPYVDDLSTVSVVDLLGTGTACVVWSSPLPKYAGASIRYLDLMGGVKPHLLTRYENGMGKAVTLSYTPSTRFYLEDKSSGRPWITKLHFPVHCLSKVETFDAVTSARFASSYTYHHGYYDHAEREFRGFGRVDQTDTEDYEHFVAGDSANVVERVLHQPPVLTKTWFHTGVYLDRERVLDQFAAEYFQAPELDGLELEGVQLPQDLSAHEWREALRACKGRALRSEVYGLDGTHAEHTPYSITQTTNRVERVQAQGGNPYASFQVVDAQTLTLHLDRNAQDPRITHDMVLESDAYGNPVLSATVGYPRRQVDTAAPASVQDVQGRTHIVVAETQFTEDRYGIFGSFDIRGQTYRLPVAWKSSAYQLYGAPAPAAPLYVAEELLHVFKEAVLAGYEDDTSTGLHKRHLADNETRFANEALDGPAAAGELGARGMPWQAYQLAFTPPLLLSLYEERVDTASFEGGYVDLNGDGNWWAPSGTALYGTDPASRFYLPEGARDALGHTSWTTLDDYLLLPVRSRDAKANETVVVNDYRTLQPVFMRDANHNWSGVEFDALGRVVKTAVMGKVPGLAEGEAPAPDAATEADNLEHPSTELTYQFYDASTGQPAFAYTKSYTRHYFGATAPRTDFLQEYAYSDGGGNVVMVKAQARPGVARQRTPDGRIEEVDTGDEVRWVGNGRTVLNNKGNPVKQYEPYFSVTHEYEDDPALVEVGVTPILFYDAAGRNDCQLNPNHTYSKTVFSPWQQVHWDVNDTLFLTRDDGSVDDDPANDPHVGHYFAGLAADEYRPTWYAARIGGGLGTEERRAAEKTVAHADTPAVAYTDALGRVVCSLEDNGDFGHYETQSVLDIEGTTLTVIDGRGNTVMQYAHNMLPPADEKTPKPALRQYSMDGGETRMLPDVLGSPVRTWDDRGRMFTRKFDALNRPTESWVTEAGADKLIAVLNYHDSDGADAADARALNLIGAAFESYDQAGRIEILEQDFKGNILSERRTLAGEYRHTLDWNSADRDALLESQTFESAVEYDALNRVTQRVAPHNPDNPGSQTWSRYDESGALDAVDAAAHGGQRKPYVRTIEYDAKGQRRRIEYGNGVVTDYDYEPDTYRLMRLASARGVDDPLQDVRFSYDPAGHISEIRDEAQQTHFFRNQVVTPHSDYVYDPIYRLIEANGREHAGQGASPSPGAGWRPEPHPNDGGAMRRYTQTYTYDSVGNMLSMAHRAGGQGWTRHYQYAPDSNHLLATTLGDPALPFDESYAHNAHGSMTRLPHLRQLDWDFAERLQHVDLDGGGHAYYVYEAGGQRTRKVVETNGSTVKERIYLGEWEIYREQVAGEMRLERETLHIMDDQRRIALVDTQTVADGERLAEPESLDRYQLGNHLGSASIELDGDGVIIAYEEFHPYGTTAYHAGTGVVEESPKRYRYTGKERDEESGFDYYGMRYCAAWLARWCAADPQGISDGVNRYLFVRGNPISNVDPDGQQARWFLLWFFMSHDNAHAPETPDYVPPPSTKNIADAAMLAPLAPAAGVLIVEEAALVGPVLAAGGRQAFTWAITHPAESSRLGLAVTGGVAELVTGAELAPGWEDIPVKGGRMLSAASELVEESARRVDDVPLGRSGATVSQVETLSARGRGGGSPPPRGAAGGGTGGGGPTGSGGGGSGDPPFVNPLPPDFVDDVAEQAGSFNPSVARRRLLESMPPDTLTQRARGNPYTPVTSPEITLFGHGEVLPGLAPVIVPENTWLLRYGPLFRTINLTRGHLISRGLLNPMRVYGPGDIVPEMRLTPPYAPRPWVDRVLFPSVGDPISVHPARPQGVLLSEILVPNMGPVNWAACLEFSPR